MNQRENQTPQQPVGTRAPHENPLPLVIIPQG